MEKDMTFEEAMQRLADIVKKLESNEITLEEGMALYREGAQCSRFCKEKLASARHELEMWRDGNIESISEEELGEN